MTKYQLTIADMDNGYCDRFLSYLLECESARVKADFINDKNYLEEYFGNGKRKTDILLIGQDMYDEKADYSSAKTVVVMTGGRITADLADRHVINKYQAADILVKEILRIYQEEHPEEQNIERKRGNCKIVGIFSPVSKCGKTTCAIALSKALAGAGKSVLYLNLEDYPSTEAYFETNNKNAMSDVLYYTKEQNRNFTSKLMEMAEKTEERSVYYLSPPVSAADTEKITSDNWEFAMNELKSGSGFDYVVADFSSRYDEKTLRQLSCCDLLVMLTSTEHSDRIKIDFFFQTLELAGSELFRHNSVRILNQYSPAIPFDIPKGGCGIPYVSNLVDKSQRPYLVNADSVMGKILTNTILSFRTGENR